MMSYNLLLLLLLAYAVGLYVFYKTIDEWLAGFAFAVTQIVMIITIYIYN